MARATYEKAVRSVLLVALGLPSSVVIFTEEAGPHLKGEFATVRVNPPAKKGTVSHTMLEGPPEVTRIVSFYRGMAEVQIFGDNARDLALDLINKLERDTAVTDAEASSGVSLSPGSGIAPIELGPFRDTEFERRTVIELAYTFAQCTDVTTEAIENFELTNNV